MSSISIIDEQKLANLLLDPKLGELEDLLSEFNVFTILDIVEFEIRHSTFLAWLLDPKENHGLRDYFLRQFLKRIYNNAHYSIDERLSIVDLDIISLDNVKVTKEWRVAGNRQRMDIVLEISNVLINEINMTLFVVIENKIKSKQGKSQLEEYYELIQQYAKSLTMQPDEFIIIPIYLTASGEEPKHEKWISHDYEKIADQIGSVIKYKESSLSDDVQLFIKHYHNTLRRYVVGKGDVERMVRIIYEKHREAIEIINEYKPDIRSFIKEFLSELISNSPLKFTDEPRKAHIRFTTKDIAEKMKSIQKGHTVNDKLVFFEFWNVQGKLRLNLLLGPSHDDVVRNKLYEHLMESKYLKRPSKQISPSYATFRIKNTSVYQFLKYEDAKITLDDPMKKNMEERFDIFMTKILPEFEKELLSWSG
ncbi:MAG: PD-(D/E)XK nuclease family protein [Candidatus Marinimicrobia bacterium]|nr:PD-(D/E)XK nuclease family protein [Candidatus Neomarinimicrobiota bacterium]